MQIESTRFGTIEVDPDTVIEFPVPLAGFENSRRYKLLHEDIGNPIIVWLQSLDEPDVAFNLIDPAQLGLTYEIELSDAESAALQMQNPADVSVLLLIGKEEEHLAPKPSSPILINTRARLGLQKSGIRAQIIFTNR